MKPFFQQPVNCRAPGYRLRIRRIRHLLVAAIILGCAAPTGLALADPYDAVDAAVNSTATDDAALRAMWNKALQDLDHIPDGKRTFLQCYWRTVLLYRLGRSQEGESGRQACVREIVVAHGPADSKTKAINIMTDHAIALGRQNLSAQVSALQTSLQSSQGQVTQCQALLAQEEGHVVIATNRTLALSKRLDETNRNLQQLTADPQIQKRIEEVSALKGAKHQIDRATQESASDVSGGARSPLPAKTNGGPRSPVRPHLHAHPDPKDE